ncbi:MAG TPA: VIT domain-containing protein [Thermoanaerobaculia bacterium]|nr:VIT domain-containing protein [Thermoanaerobaculia bacterium]
MRSVRLAALCFFLVTGSGLAQEADRQGLYFGGEPAPVLGTTVEVRVTGIIARAKVTQIFKNPSKDWVEGIYLFPLPEEAAVDTLKMKVGDRIILGVIQEKEEARQTYENAKEQGSKASLVEQERPDVFSTSVANVGPGETVEVAIEMQQVVKWDRGRFSLRFPRVVRPEEGKAAPKEGHPFSFHTDLYPGFPLAKVESPSHAITVAKGKNFRYAVDLTKGVETAASDLVLEWTPAVGREPRAVFYSEEVDGEKYALLMVMPPDTPGAAAARLPRETVFIIDTSGSMEGTSIHQAREALLVGLDKLQPTDWFNVVEFNSAARAVFPESVPASPSAVEKARRFVAGLYASGSTQMRPALEIALRKPAPAGLVPQVIFATDGELGDEGPVVHFLKASLGNRRLFPVAIGAAPNAPLLRRLADLGRGSFTHIASTGQVAATMSALFSRLEAPMLRQIEAQWSDPSAEAWPARIPDLYLGDPLVVSARLGDGAGPVTVSGMRGGAAWQDSFAVAADFKGAGIDKLWARKKIQALTDSLQEGADPGEVQRAVTALGLRHRLVTDHTSLVAVDPQVTAPSGLQPVRRVVPASPEDGPMEEMITVTAESPLLDERRISSGCTVSATDLEKIPTARDNAAWSVDGTFVTDDFADFDAFEIMLGVLSEAERETLCAEIQRTGWEKITLEQALAAAPSLAEALREADGAGLLRGYLAVILESRGCTEPPAEVLAEAGRYLRR